jgi:hypothetical protein
VNQGFESVQMASKPGRPKKVEAGDISGRANGQAHAGEVLRAAALSQGALVPRLLDLDAAATYLSLSPWTIRDLEAKGVLPRVRVPLPQGGELRKLLFDKTDLDRLIGAWKDAAG